MGTNMQTTIHDLPVTNRSLWTGWFLSGFATLFLIFDSIIKVLEMAPAIEATTQLGYAENLVLVLGILQLACLAVYVIPQTSVLGAILLTGYLGGAVATHVRADSDWFSLILPVLLGLLLWGGLYLRDRRLRALIPLN